MYKKFAVEHTKSADVGEPGVGDEGAGGADPLGKIALKPGPVHTELVKPLAEPPVATAARSRIRCRLGLRGPGRMLCRTVVRVPTRPENHPETPP